MLSRDIFKIFKIFSAAVVAAVQSLDDVIILPFQSIVNGILFLN
nr:MAG TPA: hypothetical protein [Caudoviricetes sp.]